MAFILADEGVHTITYRDLIEIVDARDLATIEEIIEDRRIARRVSEGAGGVQFH